jgi:hypothetical protein
MRYYRTLAKHMRYYRMLLLRVRYYGTYKITRALPPHV